MPEKIDAELPRREYIERLEARHAAVARHDVRHRRLGNLRLGVAVAGAAVLWLAFAQRGISPWWAALPAAVFAALAILHERVLRARAVCERAGNYYERALARLEDRWQGTGEPGDRYQDAAHPYSGDLDLFGRGSLFELLSTARTRMGEEVLAKWLREPAPVPEVRERQAAVAELRPAVDLREDLAVLAEAARSGVHPEALAAWGEAAPVLRSGWERVAAAVLVLLAAAAVALWIVRGIPSPFLVVALLEAGYLMRMRRRVGCVVVEVEGAAHDLAILSAVLGRLERERFTSPRLAALRAELDVDGRPPSARIARLNRLMELLDSRDHVLVRAINPFILYTVWLAFAVEAWRRRSGPALRRWVWAVGEIEALCSLAGYAYEHPDDPFPEFGGPEFAADDAWFEGEGLAHPLLPAGRAVRNDVRLGGALRVMVVSGSNMSGKSTLLRTVGVNAVLAQAGAPVRARRLRMSPLQPAASIRVTDSLQGGISRFYAEVMRLRLVVDLTRGPVPVLFLLDEFLHGTNSHDRRIGAEAIVRGLVERGAVGLVTTHDLALAQIANALGERGANAHFEDTFENGKLHFDYLLRAGVVRKSNALELMRSVGLDV